MVDTQELRTRTDGSEVVNGALGEMAVYPDAPVRKLVLLAVEGLATADDGVDSMIGSRVNEGVWDRALKKDFTRLFDSADRVALSAQNEKYESVAIWAGVARQFARSRRGAFFREIAEAQRPMLGNRKGSRSAQIATGRGLVKKIAALKKRGGRDILVLGDEEFTMALLGARLIDEVHLFINPKRVGKGVSIFERRPRVSAWRLTEARIHDCGFVYRKYSLVDQSRRPAKVDCS